MAPPSPTHIALRGRIEAEPALPGGRRGIDTVVPPRRRVGMGASEPARDER